MLAADTYARQRELWRSLAMMLALPLPGLLLSAEAPGGSIQDLVEAYGQVPLAFEVNAGQADPQVAFLARGMGYALFLTPREAVLSLRSSPPGREPGRSTDRGLVRRSSPPAVVHLRISDSNSSPRVTGLDPQAALSNYFIGNDPSRWRTGVPHFGKVRYEEVYPGIDLVYYGRQGQLEFDFVVGPGGDPRQIGLDFEGADRIETDARGDLIVHIGADALRQHKPLAYQERDGERQPVAAAYVVEGQRRATFRVGSYDTSRRLVIDPVLVYSTYLGGGGSEYATAIAVDGSGNTYVTGQTTSTNFPTVNPIQAAHAGGSDLFVTKLNAAGSALVYSTYLGGGGSEYATAIAVDGSGNTYVAGQTDSTNFPVVNPLQAAHAGGPTDGFVAKLNPTGSALVYSTYLGGGSTEYANAIAVDGSGNTYVTGQTTSTNFPVVNPIQGMYSGQGDAFVAKLSPAGSALVYSTYLGQTKSDHANAIAVDGLGNPYVTGYTFSTNFPTVNPIQAAHAGGSDLFVTKLNAAGSALVYSTYLGGGGSEYGEGVAVDGSGNAHVTGYTTSTNFPVVNPIQAAHAGGSADAFVASLNPTGSALVYSTYLGGGGSEYATAIAVDGSGNTYVTGRTDSTNFPTVNPIQAASAGSYDGFVAKLNAPGSALVYSTYLGGSVNESAFGIAVDGSGNAYVTGYTTSTNFPTVNPIQAAHATGIYDVFVAKIAGKVKGDMNRDGSPDLVFRSNVNGAQNSLWLMRGVLRTYAVSISPDAVSSDWKIRGVDDFNADDTNDLVFWNQVTGTVEFWLMNGTARTGAPVPLSGGAVLPTNWDLAATADFNHDGRPDVVWRNFATQKIVIWTMNGTAKLGNIAPTPDQAVDANWMVVAALDYNNDGNTDFLWYNYSSGKIVTWYMNASVVRTAGQFTTPANAGDANWKVVASSDYSRNYVPGTPPLGSPDIVWRNETSGNQVVWHLDFNSTRVHGEFTNPTANTPALDWAIVGPR